MSAAAEEFAREIRHAWRLARAARRLASLFLLGVVGTLGALWLGLPLGLVLGSTWLVLTLALIVALWAQVRLVSWPVDYWLGGTVMVSIGVASVALATGVGP